MDDRMDAPDIEYAVLQRILAEGSIRRAESLGLREWHFSDHVMRGAYEAIQRHSRRKATLNQTPSKAYMAKVYPNYPVSDIVPEETLPELISEMLNSALSRELTATLIDLTTMVTTFKQPDVALNHMANKVRELAKESGAPAHHMMDLSQGLGQSLKTYKQLKDGMGITGFPWPWEPLNAGLQGHCNGKLTVIYAPSKAGKTWTLLQGAVVFPFLTSNAKVLVISTEMPTDEIWGRVAVLLARIPYSSYVQGNLTHEQEQALEQTVSALQSEDFNALPDSAEDTSETRHRHIRVVFTQDLEAVKSLVDEYEPDMLAIDGIYNLAGTKGENHAEVKRAVQEVKALALDRNLPVVATAQTNRSGWGKLKDVDPTSYSDIGMSAGIVFFADALIRLHRFKIEGVGYKQYVSVPANRVGCVEPFVINFVPGEDHGLYATDVSPQVAADWADWEDGEEARRELPKADPAQFKPKGKFL